MDKTKELSPASIEEKRLLARAFEAFNSSIEKLRAYQLKLEEQIRELKHELEVKNQELTNILQSLPSGLIVTDLAGRILNFNRSAGAITGIERDAAMGAEINALMGHAVLPHPLDDEALSLISNGYGQRFKITKDADTRTLETDTTLTVSEDGQRLGIIINLSDTTLIDRLKEEAERKRRLAAMGEIAMQVAHEVRNPLGSIELFVSMMKKDAAPGSDELEMIEHILGATRSMNHIISNLLEYTRPRPVELDLIDLHEILTDFVGFANHYANAQGVVISFLPEAENPRIQGNKELLKQVFLNIFMNACQAMEEESGGSFTIHTFSYVERDPLVLQRFQGRVLGPEGLQVLRIALRDTGKGMTEEVKRKLFDPFFTTREQGTGLGMSIVYKTIASHGGTILVHSELGSGSEFSLLFPQESDGG